MAARPEPWSDPAASRAEAESTLDPDALLYAERSGLFVQRAPPREMNTLLGEVGEVLMPLRRARRSLPDLRKRLMALSVMEAPHLMAGVRWPEELDADKRGAAEHRFEDLTSLLNGLLDLARIGKETDAALARLAKPVKRDARALAAQAMVAWAQKSEKQRPTPRSLALLAVAGGLETPCRTDVEWDRRVLGWKKALIRAR